MGKAGLGSYLPTGRTFGQEAVMATLHIEHPITDFETWTAAFDRFAEARRQAGVRSHRIQRPVDDPNLVVVDLDFDTTAAAEAFESFLRTTVWAMRELSPALGGRPQTWIIARSSHRGGHPASC